MCAGLEGVLNCLRSAEWTAAAQVNTVCSFMRTFIYYGDILVFARVWFVSLPSATHICTHQRIFKGKGMMNDLIHSMNKKAVEYAEYMNR